MDDSEIQAALSEYMAAAAGNTETALRIAISDLLLVSAEAALRNRALDQWTSRGYVRGRASVILAVQHAARDRAGLTEPNR